MIERTLRAQAHYLRAAGGAALPRADETAAERLEEMLVSVEDVLGRLARDEDVDDETARRLFILRDEVSAQLLAAATLEKIELPWEAVLAVLRRAAAATRAGLAGLAGDLAGRHTPNLPAAAAQGVGAVPVEDELVLGR